MMMYVNQYTLAKELAHQQALFNSAKIRFAQVKRVADEYNHYLATTVFYDFDEFDRAGAYMHKARDLLQYARMRKTHYERRVNALKELLDTYENYEKW